MKKAVQLYSIRILAEKDMEQALKIVHEIGYEGVEFAGFHGNDPKDIALWLKKYNLTAVSHHVGFDDMVNTPQKVIADNKAIGNINICCPWYNFPNIEEFNIFAEKFESVREIYQNAGMNLLYHNHAHEFEKLDDKYIIDHILEKLDFLSMEFDIYWVYRGKEDAISYLEKYKDRVFLFHAKDGDMENGLTLGQGNANVKNVIDYLKTTNMQWAIVESESSDEENAQVMSIKEDYKKLLEMLK